MSVYIVSSDRSILNHWAKALKKYRPISMESINLLSLPNSGIMFLHDKSSSPEILEEMMNVNQCKVMILSMLPDFLKAQELITKGIVGYGNAMMHESHFHSAYQAMEEGKIWLYPDFISGLITQLSQQRPKDVTTHSALDKLSSREREVALQLAQGLTHYEISEKLHITVRTIKAHCSAIYEKLNVKDRLALSVLLHS